LKVKSIKFVKLKVVTANRLYACFVFKFTEFWKKVALHCDTNLEKEGSLFAWIKVRKKAGIK